jgi:hypothetical protein
MKAIRIFFVGLYLVCTLGPTPPDGSFCHFIERDLGNSFGVTNSSYYVEAAQVSEGLCSVYDRSAVLVAMRDMVDDRSVLTQTNQPTTANSSENSSSVNTQSGRSVSDNKRSHNFHSDRDYDYSDRISHDSSQAKNYQSCANARPQSSEKQLVVEQKKIQRKDQEREKLYFREIKALFTALIDRMRASDAHFVPKHLIKRHVALKESIASFCDTSGKAYPFVSRTNRSYSPSHDVQQFAQKYGIGDVEQIFLSQSFYNLYEDQLHSEFLEQLVDAEIISTTHSAQGNPFLDALGESVAIGLEANQNAMPTVATALADFGWKLLDAAKAFAANPYCIDVQEGILLGCKKVTHTVLHPIESAKNLLFCTGIVIGGTAILFATLPFASGFAAFKTAQFGYHLSQSDDIHAELAKLGMSIIELKMWTAEQLQKIDSHVVVKQCTALAVETFLTGKIFKMIGSLCARLKPLIVSAMQVVTSPIKLVPALAGAVNEVGVVQKVPVHAVEIIAENQLAAGCPASCMQVYEKLKIALKIEEFSSIIKTTKHGAQRLIERGFEIEEVLQLVNKPDYLRIQADGAKVYVKAIGERFNVIVLSEYEEEVVTSLKNIDGRAVRNLSANYGWK